MENRLLQKWPRFPEGDKLEARKKLLMFSFFLLISIIIWLFNAMGKNYTTIIDYPVEYTNLPPDKVLVGKLPEKLDLRVNSHGYALLRYKLIARQEPIGFNVSSFAMNRLGGDSAKLFILTRYIRDQVARQLPAELQLLDIKPDSLLFHFAGLKSKRVPVKSNLRFVMDKQFTIRNGIVFYPDSVDITGPDFIIDTVSYILTRNTDLGLISKSFRDKVKLSGIENVQMSHNQVDCTIEIERFTELQFYVPVEALNMPDTMTIQTFPSTVKVTCTIGLSLYERIDKNLFRATIDYLGIAESSNRLPVSLKNVPAYVKRYDYHPRTVEFLLSEK